MPSNKEVVAFVKEKRDKAKLQDFKLKSTMMKRNRKNKKKNLSAQDFLGDLI